MRAGEDFDIEPCDTNYEKMKYYWK